MGNSTDIDYRFDIDQMDTVLKSRCPTEMYET